jgi:hypothetical protein
MKFSSFTTKTYSQIINDLISSQIFLSGVDTDNNENIKVNFLELLSNGNNIGVGGQIYKDNTGKTLNLRSLLTSSTVQVNQNTNDLTFDVRPANISINDLSAILGYNKGGIGAALSEPEEGDRLLGYIGSESSSDFIEIGNNLSLDNKVLSAAGNSPLTTKGDLTVYTNAVTRLSVGTDTQILEVDSAQPSGLKWANKPSNTDEQIKVDVAATAGYLGTTSSTGVIRTSSDILKTDGGNFITLALNKENIPLSDFNNDISYEQQYDSGWLNVPDLAINTTYGLHDTGFTNVGRVLQFKVINRFVIFRGYLTIPLNDGEGLVTDYNAAKTTNKADVATFDSNYTVDNKSIITTTLFDGTTLRPSNEINYSNIFSNRLISEKNTTQGIPLTTFLPSIKFNTDGTIKISTLNDLDTGSSTLNTSLTLLSLYRQLCTVATADEYALSFTSFRSTANANDSLNNVATKSAFQYPATIDATNATDLGGFQINMDGMFYNISKDTTINAIKTAVEAL